MALLELRAPRLVARAPARPEPFAPGPRPVRRRREDLPRRGAVLAVAVLTAIAAAVRLAIPRGIWLDEAISIHQARLPLGPMLDELAQTDRHPPLHHLALWATLRAFGDGELAMRLPALVAGVALVPALYALGAELYDRRCGVAAATLGVVSPLMVWYAQEARMYAFVTLFAALSAWMQARALRRGGARDWIGYVLAASALMWSHYGGLAVLAAQQVVFAAAALDRRRDGARLRALLAGWGVAAVALAWQLVPLLSLASEQFRSSGAAETFGSTQFNVGSGGGALSVYGLLTNLVWALWGYQPDGVTQLLTATWPLFLIAGVVLLGRGLGRSTFLLLALAVLPFAAFLVAGLANRDLFEIRYVVGCVPAALVLLARLTTSWPAGTRGKAIATLALTATFAVALADQQLNPGNPRRYDFREAFATIDAATQPGDALVLEPRDLRYVAEYYAPSLRRVPLDAGLPSRRLARRVVLLASFQNDPRFRRPVETALGALRATRRLVRVERHPQADVYIFR